MNEKQIRRTVLGVFCISGSSALIYEVVWTRALSLLLGSTVYALSTMLATFMAGLALGAYFGGKIADRKENLLLYFGLFELGIALFGFITVPVIYGLPPVYFWVYKNFHLNPTVYFVAQFFLCFAIMIVPTTLMGATFPVVSKRITDDMNTMGRMVGDAYSFNTLGAILGSIAAGFLLIPVLGVSRAALVAAGLNTLAGIVMLVISGTLLSRKVAVSAGIIVILLIPFFTKYRGDATVGTFYRVERFADYESVKHADRLQDERLVYERDHAEGTIRAFVDNGVLTIQNGGKMEGTSREDVANTLMLVTLPTAAYERKPDNIFVIGLGAGVTSWFSKQVAPDVDVVEINPGVAKVVSKYGLPGAVDGVNLFIDDARRHLQLTEKKYDIITSEPSIPSESLSANLYSREFYEIAASRLKKGGIFCQWMPAWTMTRRDTHVAVKTFGSVFDYTYLWVLLTTEDFIMIGSKEPIPFSGEEIAQRAYALDIKPPEFSGFRMSRDELLSGYGKLQLIRGPDRIREIVERPDLPLITDDRPYLEFAITENLLLGMDFKKFRE